MKPSNSSKSVVLNLTDLTQDEQIFWHWSQDQSSFTKLVVMNLLVKIQLLREPESDDAYGQMDLNLSKPN